MSQSQLLLQVQEPETEVNRELFKKLFRKSLNQLGLKQTSVAQAIGICHNRFSEKLNGRGGTAFFNLKDLAGIISYLDSQYAFHTQKEKVELFLAGLPKSNVESAATRLALVKRWLGEDITTETTLELEANPQSVVTQLHNKPANQHLPMLPLTSFLGRASELKFCKELLLTKKARLLTITGMGGIGKTRMALELAHDLVKAGCYTDGISFIRLETARSGAEFVRQLYATFGLTIPENANNQNQLETEIEELTDYLADKHMLLILDNLEQLLDDTAANTIMSLLSHTPRLQILTTSREITRIPGEHVLRLEPLGLPPKELDLETASENTILKYPAVALFIDRSVTASSGITITATPSVVTLCHKLSGIPLALELAAAQTRYASPDELLKRLTMANFADVSSLATNLRFVPQRHMSIEAVIAWSVNLLNQSEKELLILLASLGEYFTLTDVVNSQAFGSGVAGLLHSLVDKSLVQVEHLKTISKTGHEVTTTTTRYTILGLIRAYLTVCSPLPDPNYTHSQLPAQIRPMPLEFDPN